MEKIYLLLILTTRDMLSLECGFTFIEIVPLKYLYNRKMEENINKVFGKKIAALRKNQHLSQEEFADRCGLHRTYVGAIERGEKSPTLNTIKKLIDGLNVDISTIFNI